MKTVELFVGNLGPSIINLVTAPDASGNQIPYPLGDSDVSFKMIDATTGAVVVDSAATVVNPDATEPTDQDAGVVRFDWTPGTTDIAGSYVAWFRIEPTNNQTQDTDEFTILIKEHFSGGGGAYTSVAALKAFASWPAVKDADDAWLAVNIIPRAEAWLNGFGPFINATCPQLKLGANVIAEFIFRMNDPSGLGQFKSESIGDYSYTINDIASLSPEDFAGVMQEVAQLVEPCVDWRTSTLPFDAGSTQVFAPVRGYEIERRTGRMTHTFDLSQETRFIRSWREQFLLGDYPIWNPPGTSLFP